MGSICTMICTAKSNGIAAALAAAAALAFFGGRRSLQGWSLRNKRKRSLRLLRKLEEWRNFSEHSKVCISFLHVVSRFLPTHSTRTVCQVCRLQSSKYTHHTAVHTTGFAAHVKTVIYLLNTHTRSGPSLARERTQRRSPDVVRRSGPSTENAIPFVPALLTKLMTAQLCLSPLRLPPSSFTKVIAASTAGRCRHCGQDAFHWSLHSASKTHRIGPHTTPRKLLLQDHAVPAEC